MKIVFLAPFGIRPKGTVIARMIPLAAELQRAGHDVVIVAPPYTNPEDSGRSEVVRGVRLENVLLGSKRKVLAAPVLAWRMFRAAAKEKPDVVHLFKPKGYGGLAAMLQMALRGAGLRLPVVFVDTDDWEGKGGMNDLHPYGGVEKRFYAFQEGWLCRRAAGVSVASRALEELVLAMPVDRSRLLYLPNCAAETPPGEGAKVRLRLGIPENAPVVLLYTRFFEFPQEKLYLVFERIREEVPAVRFLVVGKGRLGEDEQLIEAARSRGFGDAVVRAGWIEPTELSDYLAAGDVAIYPFADNLVNRTKCPAKLTELLLAERPVVADRVGQIAEYVADGVSGLLCDPQRWEEMAQRTVELLGAPERRRELGMAGRARLLERFNWRDAAERLEAFYLKRGH